MPKEPKLVKGVDSPGAVKGTTVKDSTRYEGQQGSAITENALRRIRVETVASKTPVASQTGEVGGPKGLEPTRYGDWESKGRCHDF